MTTERGCLRSGANRLMLSVERGRHPLNDLRSSKNTGLGQTAPEHHRTLVYRVQFSEVRVAAPGMVWLLNPRAAIVMRIVQVIDCVVEMRDAFSKTLEKPVAIRSWAHVM